jgi:hypothetical protein
MATETKRVAHTPGLWIADGAARVQGKVEGSMYDICHMDTVPPHIKGAHRIQEANAQLVAAAPDLLSACKAWVDYFDDLNRHADPFDALTRIRNRFHEKRVEQSRAAIAKAEGNQ